MADVSQPPPSPPPPLPPSPPLPPAGGFPEWVYYAIVGGTVSFLIAVFVIGLIIRRCCRRRAHAGPISFSCPPNHQPPHADPPLVSPASVAELDLDAEYDPTCQQPTTLAIAPRHGERRERRRERERVRRVPRPIVMQDTSSPSMMTSAVRDELRWADEQC